MTEVWLALLSFGLAVVLTFGVASAREKRQAGGVCGLPRRTL